MLLLQYWYLYAIERTFDKKHTDEPPHFSGVALAARRRKLGLSQEALARRSGVATVTIAKLEEGRISDPRGSTLMKLAEALRCRVDALFNPGAQLHGGGHARWLDLRND